MQYKKKNLKIKVLFIDFNNSALIPIPTQIYNIIYKYMSQHQDSSV